MKKYKFYFNEEEIILLTEILKEASCQNDIDNEKLEIIGLLLDKINAASEIILDRNEIKLIKELLIESAKTRESELLEIISLLGSFVLQDENKRRNRNRVLNKLISC